MKDGQQMWQNGVATLGRSWPPWHIAFVAGWLVSLMAQSSGQQLIILQNCSLRASTAYSTYSVSEAVERNDPDEPLPINSQFDDESWKEYLQQAALPSMILFVVGCCCLCGLCCWNACCMNKRLDEPGTCVPGEGWAEEGSKLRVGAWTIMIFVIIGTIAFTVLGLLANSAESKAIKGVPAVLSDYASFLSQDVGGALTCLSNKTDAISAAASGVPGCSVAGTTALSVVSTAARSISEVVGSTANKSGIVGIVDDTARSLEKISDSVSERNSAFADLFEMCLLGIILVLATCVCLNTGLGLVMGANPNTNHLYCSLCVLSECMVNIMFPLLLVACVLLFILRFSAGFCSNPFGLIAKSAGSTSRTAYYVKCSTFDDVTNLAEWIWATEQQEVQATYNGMRQALADAQGACSSSPEMVALTSTITSLEPECVGLNSVLGVNGVLSCASVDRLLQGSMTKICTDVFNPLDLIVICLIGFAFVVVCLNCINHRLRREKEALIFRQGGSVGTLESRPASFSENMSKKKSTREQKAIVNNPVFNQPTARVSMDSALGVNDFSDIEEPPHISRGEAQDLLKDRGFREGDYIIRRSNNLPGGYVITCVHEGKCYNEVIRRDGAVLMYHDFALGGHFSEAIDSLRTDVKLEPQGCPTPGGFHIYSPRDIVAKRNSVSSQGPVEGAVLPGQQLALDETEFERERKRKALERQKQRLSQTSTLSGSPDLEDDHVALLPEYDVVSPDIGDQPTEVHVAMGSIDGYSPEDIGTELLIKTLTQDHGHPIMGKIRFVGVANRPGNDEPVVGVELDEDVGDTDGSLAEDNVVYRYFTCAPGRGLLASPFAVAKLSEAGDYEYSYESQSASDVHA